MSFWDLIFGSPTKLLKDITNAAERVGSEYPPLEVLLSDAMLSYQRESVIRCLDERGAILLSPSSSTPMDYQLIKDTPLAHKVVVNVESLLEELHEIANEVSV